MTSDKMTLDKALSLFQLADIPVLKSWELMNQYWCYNPDYPQYDKKILENPWFLLQTPYGLIKIGKRKRVVSISWKNTEVRGIVTEDDVTKSPTMVHSWSDEHTLRYLKAFKLLAESQIVQAPPQALDEVPPSPHSEFETYEFALRVFKWLTMGHNYVGTSAKWMVQTLTGTPLGVKGTPYPLDSSDYGRCRNVLQIFPELIPRFLTELKGHSPVWDEYLDRYTEMESLYTQGKKQELCDLMREIYTTKDPGYFQWRKRTYGKATSKAQEEKATILDPDR